MKPMAKLAIQFGRFLSLEAPAKKRFKETDLGTVHSGKMNFAENAGIS